MSKMATASYFSFGDSPSNAESCSLYAGEFKIAFLKIAGFEVAPFIVPSLIKSLNSLSK